jgi:RNA polymerase sigma-70 factor (ECF subfamily)
MPPPDADRSRSPQDVARQIRDAHGGSPEALGRLLEGCRQYLLLVANEQLDVNLRDKLGPSDLVQDTFAEAQRDFQRFQGHTRDQLLAWLRRILLNNLADARRHYRRAGKRDVARELPLSNVPRDQVRRNLVQDADSPASRLAAREEAESLRRALDQLPEASRQLIEWRNYELCSFAEMGRRLGKSEEAARKAWGRAIEQLQRILETQA